MDIPKNKVQRTMKNTTSVIASRRVLLPACMAALLISCAKNHESRPQVWSTKTESMLGMKTDAPTLNVGEPLPIMPSAENLREPAISLLLQASDSPSPLLRANALEGLHSAPEHVEQVVRRALGDENRGVRFVAAMSVGK